MMRKPTLLLLTILFTLFHSCKKDPISDSPFFDGPVKLGPGEWTHLPKIVGFVNNTFIDENGDPFFPWGFNYTNPVIIGLVEDNWDDEETWSIIEGDFQEMQAYGANTVRIHLQYIKYMLSPTQPDYDAFNKLKRLARIATRNNLYLLVTGLGSYRLSDQQPWYDNLNDAGRRKAQKTFWRTVAKVLKNYGCVFGYDLINEPVVSSGCCPDTICCTWYPENGQFGGYQFVQNISITYGRPYWESIGSWTDVMTNGIRTKDQQTMITVGLLPLGPINSIASHFDIVSTHIYPESGNITQSVNYVINNQSDKPFLISEFFNLACDTTGLGEFLSGADGYYHGVIGHYFGRTLEEHDTTLLVDVIQKQFLEFFIDNNPN